MRDSWVDKRARTRAHTHAIEADRFLYWTGAGVAVGSLAFVGGVSVSCGARANKTTAK